MTGLLLPPSPLKGASPENAFSTFIYSFIKSKIFKLSFWKFARDLQNTQTQTQNSNTQKMENSNSNLNL